MKTIQETVIVNRPVQEVFSFMSNGENGPRFELELVESKRLSGDGGVGTMYRDVRQIMGMRMPANRTVTVYEPNHRFQLRSALGPMQAEGTVLIEPAAGSAKVTTMLTVKGSGPFQLLEPLFARILHRQMKLNVQQLKKVLETDSTL